MLQFFQRHEINKMHKTPIVSLIFTFLFSLFFTWAALPLCICLFAFAFACGKEAKPPQANRQMQSGKCRPSEKK
jgi:hypothetical protein